MENQFQRTKLLIGQEGMDHLEKAHVAVFGIGGVGGFTVEALARSGVGKIDLIDDDTVCLSNLNRQIIATHKTIGQYKVDVMKNRILEINPRAEVFVYRCFFLPENAERFSWEKYDYIVDAVDTVTAKIELVIQANQVGVPIISSMGAGNKLDPTRFQVADLYKTSVCPLAKVMRRELRKRGIDHLNVVYSTEEAFIPENLEEEEFPDHAENVSSNKIRKKRVTPGSIAFVPSVVGMIMAGEVIKDLMV